MDDANFFNKEYKKICVTNRHLASGNFLDRIEIVLNGGCAPDILILREKDLWEREYAALAKKISKLCANAGTEFIIHTFKETAEKLGEKKIHLSMSALEDMSEDERAKFDVIGASIHSKEEAARAAKLGTSYVVAGHIFETDCKKGKEPKGTGFLKEICGMLSIPVYAIGGINEKNAMSCVKAGAAGICMMSGYMSGKDLPLFTN